MIPGSGGVPLFTFDRPVLNKSGQLAFQAGLVNAVLDTSAVVADRGSGLQVLVKPGDSLPGLDQPFVGSDQPVHLSNDGVVAFSGSYELPDERFDARGLWVEDGSGLYTIGFRGKEIGGREVFSFERDLALDQAGRLYFEGSGGHYVTVPGSDVFEEIPYGPGNGTVYPDGDALYGSPNVLNVRSGGQIVFQIEAGVTQSNGLSYRFLRGNALNDDGDFVFGARTGQGVDNVQGAWLVRDGYFTELYREREAPPDAPSDIIDFVAAEAFNGRAQVAFQFQLNQGGTVQRGIYATDLDGTLHPIIRTGDLFDFDIPGIGSFPIPVTNIQLFGGPQSAGAPSSFNDRGELVFRVDFGHGVSQLMVATIPEPTTALVLLPALATLRWRIADLKPRRQTWGY